MPKPEDKSPMEEDKITNEKPISLLGIDFKKLLRAFLEVKPENEEAEEDGSGKKDELN